MQNARGKPKTTREKLALTCQIKAQNSLLMRGEKKVVMDNLHEKEKHS